MWYQLISFMLYNFHTFNVFFSLRFQNFASDLKQCYCAKYVCLSVYECLQKYVCMHIITYLIIKWPVFPSLTKLCKSNWRAKSVSTSNISQSSSCSSNYMCTTVTCCLTLNGRTIFIKAHSIDNNTIRCICY